MSCPLKVYYYRYTKVASFGAAAFKLGAILPFAKYILIKQGPEREGWPKLSRDLTANRLHLRDGSMSESGLLAQLWREFDPNVNVDAPGPRISTIC